MTNELKQRFIALLEQDAAQAHKVAQAWQELREHDARLEDAQGKTIATAAEMVARCTEKETELRALIAKIKAE
ncbi:MAG TPA: hypothetical protein VK728_00700 [Candidatus Sulfotelmatobacter sp.]|jgi:hypothetical protein|nr:hypothetical protein [Candidatus Sulfotelmatobacter sp.]